eukprot:CAMPEP_0181296346 /NCGR_PEP_ID=MMETSP1101-20121128/4654_1 /TAXON_ID=46948 /ORGANISM="Rhodomonas abbreviata, Strain Caron Lab Isolate" /LENGTH=141 /DNA_ID=CAMNT_0023401203 /DNA_START=616 /DNA_END=1037 /DNA_ORIENTATION=+
MRLASFTALIGTPVLHLWFPILEKLVPLAGKGSVLAKRVAGRVLIDQAFCSPPILAAFLGYVSLAEGRTAEEAKKKIANDLPELLPLNWALWWAPVHMITFSIVPDRFRMLWIGSVNLVWGTVLSSFSASEPPSVEMPPSA